MVRVIHKSYHKLMDALAHGLKTAHSRDYPLHKQYMMVGNGQELAEVVAVTLERDGQGDVTVAKVDLKLATKLAPAEPAEPVRLSKCVRCLRTVESVSSDGQCSNCEPATPVPCRCIRCLGVVTWVSPKGHCTSCLKDIASSISPTEQQDLLPIDEGDGDEEANHYLKD